MNSSKKHTKHPVLLFQSMLTVSNITLSLHNPNHKEAYICQSTCEETVTPTIG